jgi:thymidine phosphorylase
MIRAQGGDPDAPLPQAKETEVVRAETDGVVEAVDAYGIGIAAWRLGAGRARKEDPVSFGAGVLLKARPGDAVTRGQPLLELRTDEGSRMATARDAAEQAVSVAQAAPDRRPIVIDRIA